MGSKTIVSLLLHVIIVSITLTDAQMICYTTGNFTANSTYAKNRDLALRSLASNVTNNGGFYNTTIGLGNDTVYGLVLCMASPSAENCSSCVNDAIRTLMASCPNQKEAISWGGNPVPCIVHYGNRYFLGSLELSPTDAGYNTGLIDANFRQFLQIWSGLMTDTVTIASTSSSRLMPAAETADLSSTQKIYVFMQCTPDVSPRKENTASRTVIVTIVPTAIFLALVILILTIFCFRKPKQEGILADGQAIAVKRLSSNSGQGEAEFKNEVRLLAKLDHRNLVRLLGFCLEGTEKLLIYEFVPNSSLDQFIHDPNKRFILDWEKRYKIIEGIARGILYLHQDSQLRIIHRDLKPSNILLDGNMNAKISDFGMAKLMKTDQTHDAASRIAGTFGYIAPEYARKRQFSVKSDVFSFGVLVLEIVSGQKPSFRDGDDIEHLTSHAWRRWREGTALDLIDPILRNESTAGMMRCIHIGLLCVQDNVADRPTMAAVVLMLSNSSFTLQIPSKPAFFISRRTDQPASSLISYTSRMTQSQLKIVPPSKNEISITELDPR
ncbi:hypothetical protein POTOM_026929 [Populus tomentosa]|uniref:Uncharacterized protein n=1 Tax=Populus tomentosa TaxID=118781 RepID=A0A8X7ZKU6_POPTO|nr:hypothetical protein POTOM_026929 [Populus tomentosa]